jgi:hypothetical protein
MAIREKKREYSEHEIKEDMFHSEMTYLVTVSSKREEQRSKVSQSACIPTLTRQQYMTYLFISK